MAFVLTIIYITLTIISPEQFSEQWAAYHILEYLGALTFLTSLPTMFSRPNLKSSSQTILLIGFILVVALSQVANGWLGGAIAGWAKFLPSAAAFFFLFANVTSTRRLKIAIWTIVGATLITVVEALCGYYGGFRGDLFVLRQNLYEGERITSYVVRLRGAGFLNDPNDFAHMLAICLPLAFVGWKKNRIINNVLVVVIPFALLLWAIYLTHSRGALIALAVVPLVAVRKKLGTVVSTAFAGAMAIGMMALDFTGGRAISASEGADRLEAWSTGLELFKSAPIFGIGFNTFTDYNDITAHNSFVLCLAELGLIGSTIWVALLVSTMMDLASAIATVEQPQLPPIPSQEPTANVGDTVPFLTLWDPVPADLGGWRQYPGPRNITVGTSVADSERTPHDISVTVSRCDHPALVPSATVVTTGVETISDSVPGSIVPRHWLIAIRLALISFLITGWFLSRTYQTPLYLVLGLATSAVGLRRTDTQGKRSFRWVPLTLAVEAAAIIFVYVAVRFRR